MFKIILFYYIIVLQCKCRSCLCELNRIYADEFVSERE